MDRSTTARWRGLKNSLQHDKQPNPVNRPVIQERESDLHNYEDVDISLIQTRTYLLSAGIGDTNKQFNKYKGKIGLVLWCFNIVIHFALDFYEAWTIFGTSWATCIGLFLVTLVVCCFSMIRHSIPWFLRGVKKLKKDGNYPKTLSRVRLLVRFMPFGTVVFAIGAAAGQFGCYAADDALRVNFNLNNNTIVVPRGVETFINVLRATSLTHIFYGFASLLLFHMTLVFMIQSSMKEYNERMGKLFREVPINIEFSDAVNLFSARAKFVRDGSKKSSIVLTTLLVACCTSFVLNAYNFLFLKKHAIYIWFALAPLIWAVVPLMGAAWITKTYWQYKLVVVNAWVDIPDEHELEAEAHASLHQSHAANERPKSPAKRMWGSLVGKVGKRESNRQVLQGQDGEGTNDAELVNCAKKEGSNEHLKTNENEELNGIKTSSTDSPTRRRNSELPPNAKSNINNNDKRSSSVRLTSKTAPTIMFSDYDGENTSQQSSSKRVRIAPFTRKVSDSSSSDLQEKHANQAQPEYQQVSVEIHKKESFHEDTAGKSKDVCIDIESTDDREKELELLPAGYKSSTSYSTSSTEELSQETQDTYLNGQNAGPKSSQGHILNAQTDTLDLSSSGRSLIVPDDGKDDTKPKGPNLLSGISKTFHKWRTKTKKKKKFHYEKYIIYLESILPTVGFSIGGVIIDWNGIYTFIVIMTFMVGVFAQEAFFGT